MEEVLARRMNRYLEQADLSPHDGKRDDSFASLPSLILIDGGKGQLAAGMRALQPFIERGVTVDQPRQAAGGGLRPGPLGAARPAPPTRRPRSCCSGSATRRTASRSSTTAAAATAAMTGSVLDELKGIGPARKRALLQHFGSPERFLAATREELEAVPGLPGKVGREIHEQLNRTG